MTDEEWAKFQQWHGGGAPVGGEAVKGDPAPPWTQLPIEGAKGFAEGAAKGIVGLPGASYIEPKALADWAASSDPSHPYSEPVGKFAPLAAASMLLPDISLFEAGAYAPRLAQMASRALQEGWKGGVTGALEADPGHRKQGADTGGVSAMLAAPAARALGRFGAPVAAGAAGLAHLGGGHFFGGPWMAYHAMHPIAALARYLAHQRRAMGGPVGAVSEKAAKMLGYDTGPPESESEGAPDYQGP